MSSKRSMVIDDTVGEGWLSAVYPTSTLQDARGSVYLAGPIRHAMDFASATAWRDIAANKLESVGIRCYSPLRGKEYLRQHWGELKADGGFPCQVMSAPAGIVARDRLDVERSDVMLANLLKTQGVSIGTCIEFGWADILRVPIVMVVEKGGQHDHVMLTRLAGYVVHTLEEGIEIVDQVVG